MALSDVFECNKISGLPLLGLDCLFCNRLTPGRIDPHCALSAHATDRHYAFGEQNFTIEYELPMMPGIRHADHHKGNAIIAIEWNRRTDTRAFP